MPAPDPVPANGRRILVVDDNQDAAELASELLRSLGHDVRTAFESAGALALVDAFLPEIAILDLGLPAMDGYELAAAIRARCPESPPRLIALSGHGQPRDFARSQQAGFLRHLVKPVEIEELIESVRELAR